MGNVVEAKLSSVEQLNVTFESTSRMIAEPTIVTRKAKQLTHILSYVGKHGSECIIKKEDGGYSLTVNNPEIIAHGTRWLFGEDGYMKPTHICAVVEDVDACTEMTIEEALEDMINYTKYEKSEGKESDIRMFNELEAFKDMYKKVYFDAGDYHVVNDEDEVVYTVEA